MRHISRERSTWHGFAHVTHDGIEAHSRDRTRLLAACDRRVAQVTIEGGVGRGMPSARPPDPKGNPEKGVTPVLRPKTAACGRPSRNYQPRQRSLLRPRARAESVAHPAAHQLAVSASPCDSFCGLTKVDGYRTAQEP